MTLWATIGVESEFPWPTTELRLPFKGLEVVVSPETESLAPSVAIPYAQSADLENALFRLRQFLSCLAWTERGAIREVMALGGSHRGRVGRGPSVRPFRAPLRPRLSIDHLPEPTDEKASLALALYREALGVETTAYQFLGFFKVLNVLHSTGRKQIEWINRVIIHLESFDARRRIAGLAESVQDLGDYLYQSGRCAVAHAHTEPLVNPDNPEHRTRLIEDLPVVKALAEHLIEHELGIPSLRTIWRQHLYELEGFRSQFGPELVCNLREKRPVETKSLPPLPALSIRVRHHDPMQAFENLSAEVVALQEGRVLVTCTSRDGCVHVQVALDFPRERLEFDPMFSVTLIDDGTVRAMQSVSDQVALVEALYSNGQLEVWDHAGQRLIGRCDPYLPLNVDVNATLENLHAYSEAAQKAAKERAAHQEGSKDSK